MLLHFCSFTGLLWGNCVTFNYLRIYRTGNWMKIEISSPFTKTNKKIAKNNNNTHGVEHKNLSEIKAYAGRQQWQLQLQQQ